MVTRATAPAEPLGLRLGLSLSGGGFRTALFHLGVLLSLAERGLLSQIEALSTVSGGSVVGAAFYLRLLRAFRESGGSLSDEAIVHVVEGLARTFPVKVRTNVRVRTRSNLRAIVRMAEPGYSRSDRVGELFDELFFRGVLGQADASPRMLDLRPEVDWGPLGSGGFPKLVINATSLLTGRDWRFSPSTMGEPAREGRAQDLDKAMRFEAPEVYEDLRPHARDVPLNVAVAASAALPGGLHPMALSGVYPQDRIQLVDGGVHDNQGVQTLIDLGCSAFIVSDTGGQLLTERKPRVYAIPVLKRTSGILYGRVRQEQMFRLMGRARDDEPSPLALVHLRRGVEPGTQRFLRGDDEAPEPPTAQASAALIDERVRILLADLRTDLDAFSEVEAASLMSAGYLIAGEVVDADDWTGSELRRTDPVPSDAGAVLGLARVQDQLREPTGRLLRLLRIGRHRFFKPLRLLLPSWAVVATVVVFSTAVVIGIWSALRGLCGSCGGWITAGVVLTLVLISALVQFFPPLATVGESRAGVAFNEVRNAIAGVVMVAWAALHRRLIDPIFLRAGRLSSLGDEDAQPAPPAPPDDTPGGGGPPRKRSFTKAVMSFMSSVGTKLWSLAKAVAWWVLAVLIVGSVLALLWLWTDDDASASASHRCTQGPGSYTGHPDKPLTLKPEGESKGAVSVPFGKSRIPDARRAQFTVGGPVDEPTEKVRVVRTDFLRSDGVRLPDGRLTYETSVVGRIVTFRVCVNPADLPAGEYTGSFQVRDRRFRPLVIPVSTTLQYAAWSRVAAVALLAFLAAAFMKYAQAMREMEKPTLSRRTPADFAIWGANRGGSLAAGVVAAVGVYYASYWENPSWGSSPKQVGILLAAVFGAVVTAISGGEVAKPNTQKENLKYRIARAHPERPRA